MSTDEPGTVPYPDFDDAVVERLLDKLRSFVESLDEAERGAFAALVAPGVAQAYGPDDQTNDVVGFMVSEWAPIRLPDAIARQIRARGWHIAVDEPD